MAMGIVSDADFEKELTKSVPSKKPMPRVEVLEPEKPGRKNGDNNVPESLRKILGETAAIEGRAVALEMAANFGISPSSVSAYTKGATSTSTIDDTPNKGHIDDAKVRVTNQSRKVLMRALHEITDEKLQGSKAIELANVAKAMGGIIRDMEPPKDPGGDKPTESKPQFVVFSPQIRDERHYEILISRGD